MKIGDAFSSLSRKAAVAAGTWQAFVLAVAVVLAWCIGGFWFGFMDPAYQLIINSFTTCATFIMVFLIQADQNRSTRAIQLKLSEIICVLEKADDKLIDIEDATDEQIAEARAKIGANKANTPD